MKIAKPAHRDTFVSKRPEKDDKEVAIAHGNLLYNTETDKFLATVNGKVGGEFSWEDQSAYFVSTRNSGYTDEKEFNRIVKFITAEEGIRSVIVPVTTYRQRKTAFTHEVYVETNFGLAFTYVKFIQEQARDCGVDVTTYTNNLLNQRTLIGFDPAQDGGDTTVICIVISGETVE